MSWRNFFFVIIGLIIGNILAEIIKPMIGL